MLLSLGLPSHQALQHVLWTVCSQIQGNHCTREVNQSGSEPLKLENGLFVNCSDNFDATNLMLRF